MKFKQAFTEMMDKANQTVGYSGGAEVKFDDCSIFIGSGLPIWMRDDLMGLGNDFTMQILIRPAVTQ